MSEKTLSILEQTLVDTINATKSGISAGIDFAQKQIPDLISQLLMWKMAEAIFLALCALVFCFIFIKVWLKIKASYDLEKQSQRYADETILALYSIFGGMAFLASLFVLGCNVLTILKISIAPKLYLIEYVSYLIK